MAHGSTKRVLTVAASATYEKIAEYVKIYSVCVCFQVP